MPTPNPTLRPIGRPRVDPASRFWAKVEQGPNDCWLWVGAGVHTSHGYGRFMSGGRNSMVAAHRWSYEQMVGPIPEGLHLDHLCRTPACVNPYHLDPVPSRINNLRSESPSALNAAKTHCKRGHEFTPENTFQATPHGSRVCIECRREKDRRYYWRQKASA